MIKEENGVIKRPEERKRISWAWCIFVMISPIAIKSKDLKRAWTRRWKKEKVSKPKEKESPINPKWLKVERAISFLRSVSKILFNPA